MKQQFVKDTADVFRTYVYEHNRKIVPASAAITIYRPGGDVLIGSAAMMIGSDGLLSYDLGAGENSRAEMNYRALISYVHNSRIGYFTLFYDVVRSRLVKVITDDDIIAELPQLRDNGWSVRGVAEGGSVTTIVDSELKRYDDNYFTGGLAYSVDKDETREITGFVQATGTVTAAAFSSPITSDRYILKRSYTREIQRAFEKIEERLIRTGRRPDLILDPYELREAHIYYSVAEVCKGLSADSNTLWWGLWKEYEKKAGEVFDTLNLKYDFSLDGHISGGEASVRIKKLRPVRG